MKNQTTCTTGATVFLVFLLLSETAMALKSSAKSHQEHLLYMEQMAPFYVEGIQCDSTELENWSVIYEQFDDWRDVFSEYEGSKKLPTDIRESYQQFVDSWSPNQEVMDKCAAAKGREADAVRAGTLLLRSAASVFRDTRRLLPEFNCDAEAVEKYTAINEAAYRVHQHVSTRKQIDPQNFEKDVILLWTDRDADVGKDYSLVKAEYGFLKKTRKKSFKEMKAIAKTCRNKSEL